MVISRFFFPMVKNVHLQGQQGQLEGVGDEIEGFRGVLLVNLGCILPSAFGKGKLDVFSL